MEKKDMIIASLELMRDKSMKGEATSLAELFNHLIAKDFLSGQNDPTRHYIQQVFLKAKTGGANYDPAFISLETYFDLLDYEELQLARNDSQEARREAKTALNYARWSLILAIVVGIAQIVVQVLVR